MKNYCFTVDDNIRFLKELTNGNNRDLFEHPYLAMYRRLHEAYGVKVQLNLFYEMPGFDLSQMTERFKEQFQQNAFWLKMSFHSRLENVCPYEFSGYEEVYADCKAVQDQILRFAGQECLAQTTTIHYCRNTAQGLEALKDNGVKGLLGLFGTDAAPRTSYEVPMEDACKIRRGHIVPYLGIPMGSIDMVINDCKRENLIPCLEALMPRNQFHVMIHEQYFYPDYVRYIPDFEDMLRDIFGFMEKNAFASRFFEEMISFPACGMRN